MKKESYHSFDFIKIIFMVGVVIGHIYCLFYQDTYCSMYGYDWTSVHNICTDGFFITSGIFMAYSIEILKKAKEPSIKKAVLFKEYQLKRISRLYGPALFCTIIFLLFRIWNKEISSLELCNEWSILVMILDINGVIGQGGIWYVSALIWMGLIMSAFIIYAEQTSKYLIFPLIFFFSYTFMYATYGNDVLTATPTILGFISVGLIRCVCGLSAGAEIYWIAQYLQTSMTLKKRGSFFIGVLEIFCIFILVYIVTRRGMDSWCFLIYPSYAVLSIIFLLKWEVIFSFVNIPACSKIIKKTSKYNYMIYLSHLLILSLLKGTHIETYSVWRVYIICMFCTFSFGMLLYTFYKVIVKRLKYWLCLLIDFK